MKAFHRLATRRVCNSFNCPKSADINPNVYTRGLEYDPRRVHGNRSVVIEPLPLMVPLPVIVLALLQFIGIQATAILCTWRSLSSSTGGGDGNAMTAPKMVPSSATRKEDEPPEALVNNDINNADTLRNTWKPQGVISNVLSRFGCESGSGKDCKEPTITSAILDSCFQPWTAGKEEYANSISSSAAPTMSPSPINEVRYRKDVEGTSVDPPLALAVRSRVDHVINKPVTSHRVVFDESSSSAHCISPTQLLSLLLLPEACL
ncbi:hypothetical protein EGW08_017226 [Elysia chlorotica]|uniref:Uncharacterized protein n=1 Tax=Elysia chlorotica TaxID=188477 RepID=A0A3S1B375_ELYCH|nr:hypothetical protein EGW08_017226 [Elysia chlorotica]